jgi:hypothetical protein
MGELTQDLGFYRRDVHKIDPLNGARAVDEKTPMAIDRDPVTPGNKPHRKFRYKCLITAVHVRETP